MVCRAGHPLFQQLLNDYENDHFVKADGSFDLTTNVTRITNTLLKYGLVQNNTKQTVADFTLFPSDYFCPKDPVTKKLHLTSNTYTIHHFDGSWIPKKIKYKYMILNKLGPNISQLLVKMKRAFRKYC